MRYKLTFLYTLTFTVAIAIFVSFLFFMLQGVMDRQQVEELQGYFDAEKANFQQQAQQSSAIMIEPTRHFFYYIYRNNDELVGGASPYEQLDHALFNNFHANNKTHTTLAWQKEHVLAIKKELQHGYVLVGKTITTQQNFFKNASLTLLLATVIFTLLIGAISHFFAGKAVKPIQNTYELQKRFVSDASHELRTPLAVFQSSLDILQTEKLTPFGQEVLHDAEQESAHMEALLEQLLLLARADHHVNINKTPVDVTQLLQQIVHTFQRISAVPIDLTCEPNIHVLGDEQKLKQLFYILLDNAMRFTSEGAITIVASKEEIIIIDSGIGINAEDLPHIFERFYRGDTSRHKGGTGLGLPIAQAIVHQHDGTITVKSSHKGTCFTVVLPFFS